MLYRLIAIAIAAYGIWLLYAAWRAKADNERRLIGGWGLTFVSLIIWSATTGADKGAALGIIAVTLMAFTFLCASALQTPPRRMRAITERQISPPSNTPYDWPIILSRAWNGLLIGPIAGLCAVIISAALFSILQRAGAEHTINLTLASFAFPFMWAALAVFAAYEVRFLRKTLMILSSGLFPFIFLLITN